MPSLTLDDFDYHLPAELIAQSPAEPRDSSRLMVINRADQTISHHRFAELDQLLSPSDVLVRNNTKVIPARLFGEKETGGKVEILLLKRIQFDPGQNDLEATQKQPDTPPSGQDWQCLTKPGLKVGQRVRFTDKNLVAECVSADDYTRVIRFQVTGQESFESIIDQIGQIPLPPYIDSPQPETERRHRYQTTFAKVAGSAAAPTAGLHFTPQLDQRLVNRDVTTTELTLHVGLGTFLPVKTENIQDHHMHQEWYDLSAATAALLNQAQADKQRVVAVGTTTTRVLETVGPDFRAQTGSTEIFMYPPYRFHSVHALITNFHLPKSTLLMLVSAFVSAPNSSQPFSSFQDSLIGRAYQEAIEHGYRFYSFGDAMLIL